jgi:nucleoside-diphosphate-sugar epimerase
MIIGKGLIAREFSNYSALDDYLVFASGVSNSKSCTPADLQRERQLFLSTVKSHPSRRLIYFSTTSVNDPDLRETPYVIHKLEMEALVRTHAAHWQIFRLSNLAGASDNPNTVLNFLYHNIHNGHPFQLWKYSERNIIDVSDVHRVCDYILQKGLFPNTVVNIANPSNYPVGYIVRCLEEYTGRKAIYEEVPKGSSFGIDVADIFPIYDELHMGFGEHYLPGLLQKYYPRP